MIKKHMRGLNWIRRGAGLVMLVVTVAALAGCSQRPASKVPAAATSSAATPVVIQAAAARATQTQSAAQAASTPAAAVAAPANGAAARQAVINALRAALSAGPYHISSTTAGEKKIVMTGEVILPNRFHLITNDQEMLIIGDKTYMKQNGQWVDFPVDISGMISGMVGTMTAKTEQSISDVRMLGPDTVNGAPATLYQFHLEVDAGGNTISSTVKLWVDSLRGLPVQQQIDGEVGGIQSSTLQVITYDSTITIPEP